LAAQGEDCFIRVFSFLTGKLIKKIDERADLYNEAQQSESDVYKVDSIDFGRRMAVERELERVRMPAPKPKKIDGPRA
jgi:peptidylprolyl isomerase domain and WD repeat-containing protein 1